MTGRAWVRRGAWRDLSVLRGRRVVDEISQHGRVALRLVGLLPAVELAGEAHKAHGIVAKARGLVVRRAEAAAVAPDLFAHGNGLTHVRILPEGDANDIAVLPDVADHTELPHSGIDAATQALVAANARTAERLCWRS